VDALDVEHLRRCLELAAEARARGDEPFGSLLVGPEGTRLAEERNAVVTQRDVTAHPELLLARWASQHLDATQRAASTVYTSCEHCAMCAAATYWAGIGRIVFALSGEQLVATLPPGVPTLALAAEEVLARGGDHRVALEGPCDELAVDARAVVEGYWG
jgi:tRNA(Arg) A34 adenosine deaminase TadA